MNEQRLIYNQLNRIQKIAILLLHVQYQDRELNPEGSFDNGGRFYLANKFECCDTIRSPSRAYPYPEMLHGRTKEHILHENYSDIINTKDVSFESCGYEIPHDLNTDPKKVNLRNVRFCSKFCEQKQKALGRIT